MEGIFFVKHRRDPILIGDYMRQIGIIRSDNTVDRDLVCSLLYYESLRQPTIKTKKSMQEIRRSRTDKLLSRFARNING